MAETSSVKSYFKRCFEKKLLIEKAIIAAIALIVVLAFSLSFYCWLKNKSGIVGDENKFWYITIVHNHGVGFGNLDGKTGAVYAIQSVMFIVLLAIFLFVTNDRITASFVALAMFGGIFNLIQRAATPADSLGKYVLDYFQFGFWKSFPVFNWPDMFVVIGIFGFVISYIALLVIQYTREKNIEDSKPSSSTEEVKQPQNNEIR